MKKSFAFGEAVGLTPFARFGDATRGREPPVRAASPGPTGRDGRWAAAPFGRARDTLRVRKQGRHLPRTAHLHLRRTAGAVQVGAGDGPLPARSPPAPEGRSR
jgi:hypothetical protein